MGTTENARVRHELRKYRVASAEKRLINFAGPRGVLRFYQVGNGQMGEGCP